MSLFARERRTASVDGLEQMLLALRGAGPKSAVPVNDETAMRLGAVWSSVNLIAELVATLPVHTYRRKPDGTSEMVDNPTVIGAPSNVVSPIAWRRQVMMSWLLRGNVFGDETVTGRDGWPSKIEVLHPDDVRVRQAGKNGPLIFDVGQARDVRLWHEAAYSVPGTPLGLSPITYAAESIGLGIASRDFGAEWFGGGGHPSAVLESDQQITQDTAELIKARFLAAAKARAPIAMGAGLTYRPIQVAPNESQFLETIKANRAEIAGYFFPHLILSEGASMTYANVESRQLDLLVFDVQPWLVRFEQWLTRMLPRPLYVKFNADAIVRTTLLDRFTAHKIAIDAGFETDDEVRALEDLPPLTDAQRARIAARPKPGAATDAPT